MAVPPIRTEPRFSSTFDRYTISEIQRAAATGIYDIRGGGAKRKLPNFDDLLFLGASISRYPLEGYREKCGTNIVLGSRFAKKPIHLKIPITIAGMSFGALSAQAKEALGRGASALGTSTTTGDGGMTPEEREFVQNFVMKTYDKFLGIVAKERNLSADSLRNGLADGRILSGKDALENKLVDGLGQIEDAFGKAKQLGGAPGATVVKYGPPFSLSRFFRAFGETGKTKFSLELPRQLLPQLESGRAYFLPSYYAP